MSENMQPIQPSKPAGVPPPVAPQPQPTPVVYAVPVYSSHQEQQQYVVQTVPAATVASNALPQATIVTLNIANSFGAQPARVICPFCGADVITAVRVTPSLTAHLWALGLCVFGCWPCCIVPYFVNDCQSHVHVCPNCNHEIGYHGL